MTLFFLLAALLVIAALALLLAGPLRASANDARESDLRATDIALARQRRRELDAALAREAIDPDTHAHELERLERELAAELEALPERAQRDGTLPAVVLIAVFVPLAAGALYLRLGDPEAVTRGDLASGASAEGAIDGESSAPALAELLPRLEERLSREPNDVDGWRLLGRSYLGTEQFEPAVIALRRAVALDGTDALTLVQLAEAVAMSRGGELAGEPVELLERSLAIQPASPQGLWLLAIARQQTGAHREALTLFDELRTTIGGNADTAAMIDEMAARSRAALGTDVADASSSDGSEGGASDGSEAGGAGEAGGAAAGPDTEPPVSVSLTVDLSAEARAASTPDETVFVYARASEGPPMPLAVARFTVADLPVAVTLDENMAMMPAMSLADFPRVTLGARVSSSGDAIAASGDWFAERDGIDVGTEETVELLIDARRP